MDAIRPPPITPRSPSGLALQVATYFWFIRPERSASRKRPAINPAAARKGGQERALKLMRAAADVEDSSAKHIAMENRLYPMRELLGDLLLEQQQPVNVES